MRLDEIKTNFYKKLEKYPAVDPFNVSVKSENNFVYHATNEENLIDIANSGQIDIHPPYHGTDQSTWPDGSTNPRSYFSKNADAVKYFAPEEGSSVIIRVKKDDSFRIEAGTGDVISEIEIPSCGAEYLGIDGKWHKLK